MTDELLQAFADQLPRNEHTRKTKLIYARAYLAHAGGKFTRAAVRNFLDVLDLEGEENPLPRQRPVSPGTKLEIFRILRRVFAANEKAWPFRTGEGPVVHNRERRHVALAPELVKKAVDAARAGSLTPQESAFVALATVYGMRKMELAAVRARHLDFDKATLYCAPEKRGMERYHLVPDGLREILEAYDFGPKLTVDQADKVWGHLEAVLDFPRVPGMGWHAIRRILVTLLWEKLPEPRINRFLRWKAGEDRSMAIRYSSVQIVGDGESSFRVDEGFLEEDRAVFAVHPFVPLWRGEPSWALASAQLGFNL